MRPRTLAAFAVVVVVLGGGGGYAFVTAGGGSLDVVWVSDTPRNTTVNHHGVGAGAGIVVAPASEPGGSPDISRYSCSLVRLDPADGSTEWRWPVPRDQCFLHALTKPAVADLDEDGSQEVVAGTIEAETVVLDERGREQFGVRMDTYSYGQPTVTRLAADDPAIVASDIRGGVVVAAPDGTVRWRSNVSGSVWASPVVVDLDGDETREVVVGSSDETVAFTADGAVLWRRGVSARDVAVAHTNAGVRVLTAGFDGVAALEGATGDRTWNRSGVASPRLASVGDGDADGVPEAYLGVSGTDVLALDATDGSEEWRTRLTSGDTTVPAPVLAELDGEGTPELAAATAGGTVAILDPADGSELAAYERDVPVWTTVTPANLTADPGRELLVRYGDGRVVALAYE
jgi:outer membrane protein assembly factor BamB